MILIDVPTGITIPSGAGVSLKITNLSWPRYVLPLTPTFCFQSAVLSSDVYTQTPSNCISPSSPQPNDFILATIMVPNKRLGAVDCTYTFNFVVQNDLPPQSEILITFPTGYSLIDSDPDPSFKTNLKGDLLISMTINQLRIANVGSWEGSKLIEIIGEGIKNPSSSSRGVSDGWKVEFYLNSQLMNRKDGFFSFNFEEKQGFNIVSS
jgi:hypothetical protein